MKAIKHITFTIGLLLTVVFAEQAVAQFMPVVVDNNYGKT
jgi:hypothetical protein